LNKNANNYAQGRRAAWLGVAGNLFLSLIKFLAGIFGHSAAMIADAVHSLSDILSSLTVLVGLKIARKKPDGHHPYGHSKAESVAGQLVAVFLVFLGGMIFWNAWKDIREAEYTQPSGYVLLAAAFSIVLKEALYQYKSRLGKRIHSTSLQADAWHHRSDAFSSLAVLIGVGAVVIGVPRFRAADLIGALAVALIIGYTGIRMLLKTSSELMDEVITGPRAEMIRELACSVPGVKKVEKLFVRKAGLDKDIDIHIEVAPGLTVVEGHNIAGAVKRKLMENDGSLKSVLVHVEPFSG